MKSANTITCLAGCLVASVAVVTGSVTANLPKVSPQDVDITYDVLMKGTCHPPTFSSPGFYNADQCFAWGRERGYLLEGTFSEQNATATLSARKAFVYDMLQVTGSVGDPGVNSYINEKFDISGADMGAYVAMRALNKLFAQVRENAKVAGVTDLYFAEPARLNTDAEMEKNDKMLSEAMRTNKKTTLQLLKSEKARQFELMNEGSKIGSSDLTKRRVSPNHNDDGIANNSNATTTISKQDGVKKGILNAILLEVAFEPMNITIISSEAKIASLLKDIASNMTVLIDAKANMTRDERNATKGIVMLAVAAVDGLLENPGHGALFISNGTATMPEADIARALKDFALTMTLRIDAKAKQTSEHRAAAHRIVKLAVAALNGILDLPDEALTERALQALSKREGLHYDWKCDYGCFKAKNGVCVEKLDCTDCSTEGMLSGHCGAPMPCDPTYLDNPERCPLAGTTCHLFLVEDQWLSKCW